MHGVTLVALVALLGVVYVNGHGRLWEPAGRGTEHRRGFKVPENKKDYNDDQVYCGGRGVSDERVEQGFLTFLTRDPHV